MYYGTVIIKKTGIKFESIKDENTLSIVLNIPLAFVNAFAGLLNVFFLDSLGRRYIFLRTIPGVIASLILTSVSMYMTIYLSDPWNQLGCYFAIFSLVLYLCFFSFGMSNTTWCVNTEIYPLHLVGIANSWATATNWLCNFLVASVFLTIMDQKSGKVYAFLILAAFTAGAWVFVYNLLPETKGKPIAENVKNILQGAAKIDSANKNKHLVGDGPTHIAEAAEIYYEDDDHFARQGADVESTE